MQLAPRRRRRAPSLTPMIDVVFLLLVFFMLAARFGQDMMIELPLAGQGGQGGAYTGPPRLVEVSPSGLRLNGVDIAADALVTQLRSMMATPSDTIILRAGDAAPLQRLITVMDGLAAAGFTTLVLVE